MYFASLPGVTIILQLHHHTVRYVSARGHTPSTSTSPYCTLRLCPGSHSFYKYITILYFTSLSEVTILLQVHQHIVLYFSAQDHNPSTSASQCCTLHLCPWSQSFYKYITRLHFMSLPGVTIPLKLHHHTVRYVSVPGHIASTSSSPCCTLRLCPRWKSLYTYITILCFTSPAEVTIPLQIHHHTVLCVSVRGHNPPTITSPYCTLRHCPGSQSFYKCINMLYFTFLPGVTMLPQVHNHSALNVSTRVHNPSSSTSPYCTLRLCQGSQ